MSKWTEAAKSGSPLAELIHSFPDELEELPFVLGYCCGRWVDVQSLFDHPVMGKRARLEWDSNERSKLWRQQEVERKAKLTGVAKQVSDLMDRVWWYGAFFFGQPSHTHPEANAFITGDGMGIAYFRIDGNEPDSIAFLLACPDRKLPPFLRQFGIEEGKPFRFGQLMKALEPFVEMESRK